MGEEGGIFIVVWGLVYKQYQLPWMTTNQIGQKAFKTVGQ
jgi:hypothetical protein